MAACISFCGNEICSGKRWVSSEPANVRVKITRELRGSIDGIQLTRFLPGEVYDVSASFMSYLLTVRAAELAVEASTPGLWSDREDEAPARPSRVDN